MVKKITAILFCLICLKCTAQDSSKLIHYYIGGDIVAGITNPMLLIPGIGISLYAVSNNHKALKPLIEITANGFTEIIPFNNNPPAYGIYSLLGGAKYKFSKILKGSFLMGGAYIENDNIDISGYNSLYFTFKPAIEINNRKDKLALQVYMQNIFTNQKLKGFYGTSVIFRVR
jgi:hypothetical protein